MVAGLTVLCAVALTSRGVAFWTSVEVRRYAIWFLIGGTACGALVGTLWPVPVVKRLRLFDDRLLLADRLTTAWELAHGRITAPLALAQMQFEETRHRVREADVKTVFPARPARYSILAACVLTLLLIPALFLPNPQDTILARREAEAQFVSQAVEQITDSHDTLAQQTNLNPDEHAAALTALEQALDVLNNRQATLDEKQAALTLAEYQLAKMRTPESLTFAQQVAGVPALSEDSNLPDDSVIRRINEVLSSGNLDAASALLGDLAQAESGQQLTQDEVKALADVMAQLAAALQEQQSEAASGLDAAAQAIAEGNTGTAREGIQQAADVLSGLAQAQANDADLQQAQAGVQQAQQSLRQASGQTSDSGMGQALQGEPDSSTGAGQSGSGNATGGGEGTGNGEKSDGGHNGSAGNTDDTEIERLAAVGGEITLPRSPGEGDPQPAPGFPNEARVPYQEVYTEYAQAAEAALSSRDYPPLLRDYIRDYFSSLEE